MSANKNAAPGGHQEAAEQGLTATDIVAQLAAAMQAAGIDPPDEIIADGRLHRFSSNGERGDDAGWYVLHSDGIPAAAFGDWRTGIAETWRADLGRRMTPEEEAEARRRIEKARAEAEAERLQRAERAAALAAAIWKAAKPVTEHPYLRRKGVAHVITLRAMHVTEFARRAGYMPQARGEPLEGMLLIAPTRGREHNPASLELIDEHGRKSALAGGVKAGGYWATGMLPSSGRVVICEGVATALSIAAALGEPVAAALSVGNIKAAAETILAERPGVQIVIAADLGEEGRPHPEAVKAAQALRCPLAVPPADLGKGGDFNDLHVRDGLEAVRACIEAAAPPAGPARLEEDGWPDPQPLPEELPPVAAFDLDLLPDALRGWVADIATRMQCPADFPAVGALVALSSLIGARAVVRPKERDDWRVVPNLWGLIIGRPGVMKSPALGEALKPLHALEAAEREAWEGKHEAWEIDRKLAELTVRENEKRAAKEATKDPARARALLAPMDVPPEPMPRRFVVNDATVERLCEILEANPWGVLAYRDELHGLLCSLDRPGQEGSRAFYLQAYDGIQGYVQDRIGRGTHRIDRVCLAMLGSIQPGRLQRYVRDAVSGGAGDDGLLQRFSLTVWPDVSREFRRVDQWPDTKAKREAWAVFERFAALQPATDKEPQEWRFSPDAQAVFWEWLLPFETEIRGDGLHPALVAHLAKYRKLIPALALIFALVDTPKSQGVIGERELLRALAWGDYLRTHAERVYAAAIVPETAGARLLLEKIRAGGLKEADGTPSVAFTPRQVAVKHWTGLCTPAEVRKAADLLAEYGWLTKEETPPGAMGGRPSGRYLIHPKLLNGGAL
jgi:putative DNA primase/helicase